MEQYHPSCGTEGMDFTDAEIHMIGQITKAEKTLPDDFWCVAAVQELACFLCKIEPLMTDEQMAFLIGIGAFIARQGKAEMRAEIEMKMLFGRLSAHPSQKG